MRIHRRSRYGLLLSLTVTILLPITTTPSAGSATLASPNLHSYGYSYSPACDFGLGSVGVINDGDAEAGSFVVAYAVDHRLVGSSGYHGTLGPGESTSVGPFPSVRVSRGAHLVTFYIDSTGMVQESIETDNIEAFGFVCY